MRAIQIPRKEMFKEFLRLSLKDKIFSFFEVAYRGIQRKMNFSGSYKFLVDNRGNKENLLIILAGYQNYLYDKILGRVNKYLEPGIDVCIVSAGKMDKDLEKYAEKFGWSYLYIKENKVSLAQNIAIEHHPKAKFIYKMDEDIFITKGFFSKLKTKYNLCIKNSEYIPGAITPVLNLNAFTFMPFLNYRCANEEFQEKWGNFKHELGGIIYQSTDIAEFIRKKTFPIDDSQGKYFETQDISKNFTISGIRYSIGCMMFPRDTWKNMGGFDVSIEGTLGRDEENFLAYCINNNRPIVLCENSLCGHFSFGPQKAHMKKFFDKNSDLF